jgi:hypothetical protein
MRRAGRRFRKALERDRTKLRPLGCRRRHRSAKLWRVFLRRRLRSSLSSKDRAMSGAILMWCGELSPSANPLVSIGVNFLYVEMSSCRSCCRCRRVVDAVLFCESVTTRVKVVQIQSVHV